MRNEDVLAFLRTGTGIIAFDNNALFAHRRFTEICNRTIRFNTHYDGRLKLVVPALAHAEKLHDLRQDLGADYKLSKVQSFLNAKQADCESMLSDIGKAKKCSATIDWLIAAYAYTENCLLVTDDTGPEFHHITRKTTLATLETALIQLLEQYP